MFIRHIFVDKYNNSHREEREVRSSQDQQDTITELSII